MNRFPREHECQLEIPVLSGNQVYWSCLAACWSLLLSILAGPFKLSGRKANATVKKASGTRR